MSDDPPLKGWHRLRDLAASVYRPGLPFIGAEIGVSNGWTSEHLLQEFPCLSLLMVDIWDSFAADGDYAKSGDSMAKLSALEQRAKMRHATERTAFAADRRRVIQCDSVKAAESVPDGWLDFAFIDGAHVYESVKADLAAWSLKVVPGGLLIGHDYFHPRDRRGLWGVSQAWSEFCEATRVAWDRDKQATICWCEVPNG